ncbi:MAG: hypothetical protein HGA76_01295 [Candidatus Firestonebacteria bacterium]|nr:hypothetical protein [Candidatus Firestonebacteria bacterium]
MGLLLCLGLLPACAGLPVLSGRLEVAVTPEVIHPGDVVKIVVKAPEGTRNVRGRLDVPGSPQLPLKTQDQGKTWTFVTQIPLEAVWKPGRYRAQVRGDGPDGSVLLGETWITAP